MKMLGRSAERDFIGYSASILGQDLARPLLGSCSAKGATRMAAPILPDEEGNDWLAENCST
jgi:hypothetical protein